MHDRAKSLWLTAASVFASIFGFGLIVALENQTTQAWQSIALAQFENLAFAGVATLPILWLANSRLARRLYALLLTVLFVYMTADQVFYRIFFDHFQLGLLEGQEGGFGALKDSVLFELGTTFYVNLVVSIALGAFLFWRLGARQSEALTPEGKKGLGIGLLLIVVYGATSWHFSRSSKLSNLNLHPLVSLGKSLILPPRHDTPPIEIVADLATLRFGKPTPPNLPPDEWQPEPTRWRPAKKPNVVLIVLESVGSEQMLTNGRPSPERTPNLARRAAQITSFPFLYNTFPGTVRSHTPLSTGGRTITWGSVYEELSFPYTGPTIVSELKDAGYSAALFSAAYMETENLGGFYDQLPYDVTSYPDRWPATEKERFKVNSWGVDEREVMHRAAAWANTARSPFFLHVLTSATHHPYSTPADFKGPAPVDEDRKHRYANALAFLDDAIGKLLDELQAGGHADDTLVFVVGDHGQAFGDIHPQNLTHKNHIYEENVRNFLLVIDPAVRSGPLSINRIGALGDVAPSIIGFVTEQGKDFDGQDLYSPHYEERLVFFHKNAYPERWGLRDGRWKFAIDKVGGKNPELFDLDQDGTEQKNLASEHSEQVREYQKLVASWYIKTNDEYVKRLKGFHKAGGIQLRPDEVQSFGPKRLVFGTKGKDGKFKELTEFNPAEELIAWTYGVPFPQNQKVDYTWTAPSGKVRRFHFEFDKDWSQTEVFHSSPKLMEPGLWHLTLSIGEHRLLSGAFLVKDSAELYVRRNFP